MARMVQCKKLGRELPGMAFKPFPNELGQRIFDSISQEAWKMWLEHFKMILNEYRLAPGDPRTNQILFEQAEQFFFGEGAQLPPDYVPPPAQGVAACGARERSSSSPPTSWGTSRRASPRRPPSWPIGQDLLLHLVHRDERRASLTGRFLVNRVIWDLDGELLLLPSFHVHHAHRKARNDELCAFFDCHAGVLCRGHGLIANCAVGGGGHHIAGGTGRSTGDHCACSLRSRSMVVSTSSSDTEVCSGAMRTLLVVAEYHCGLVGEPELENERVVLRNPDPGGLSKSGVSLNWPVAQFFPDFVHEMRLGILFDDGLIHVAFDKVARRLALAETGDDGLACDTAEGFFFCLRNALRLHLDGHL